MTDIVIPAYYFPTATLMLDDDQAFLSAFSARLLAKNLLIKTAKCIKSASDLLMQQDYVQFKSVGLQDRVDDEESDINQSSVSLDIQAIEHLINSVSSLHVISTLIVDYDMPELNGIEFCKQIRQLPIKKIMLTGHSDHKLAVKAFNDGIIDRFIIKNPKTILNEVFDAVIACQKLFFQDITSSLLTIFSTKCYCALSNLNFQKLLTSKIESFETQKYYLLDEYGSYVIFDVHSHKHYVIVRPDNLFDDYADIAANNEMSMQFVKAIETRKKLPIFLNKESEKKPVIEWQNYIKEMMPLHPGSQFFIVTNDS